MSGKNEVQVVVSAQDRASSVFKSVAAAIAGAFSIREVYEFGKAAVEAASAQETAETKLAVALGRRSQALLDQAAAMQKSTVYSDETVISSQAQVAAFSRNEDAIKRVTAAAADFASAKGMDLVSASELITKSVYGQVNMLGRYGISLNGAQGSSERLESALRKLEEHFGGQAAAQANTFSGQVVILTHAYDELLKSIGFLITQNPAVMVAMDQLKQLFGDLGNAAQRNQVYLMQMVRDGLSYVVRGLGVAVNAVFSFQYAWQLLETVMQGVIYGIVTALDWIITPISWVMDKLVEFGAADYNPFKSTAEGISSYRDLVHDAMVQSANDMDATGVKMAIVSQRSNAMADVISSIEIPAVKAGTAAVKGKGDAHELTGNQIAEQMKLEVDYLKQLSALYTVYGSTKPEMQKMDLSVFDAETTARMAAMKAQNATGAAIAQEESIRAMARTVLVEQQKQENETLMASFTRMAATYDMAGGIIEARQEELNRVKQAGTNIHLAADKAMESQLLRLVEAHKFSVAAIGQAIMQQVKMEILGIAAKAAVYAIFYAAYGLGLLAMGDPRSAAAFASAAEFATIAGVAVAAAAAVNLISGPGAQQAAQGSNPSNPTYTSSVPTPTTSAQQPAQQITINIANGTGSRDYWDNLMEDQIIPAINRAGNRNVQLTIQTA